MDLYMPLVEKPDRQLAQSPSILTSNPNELTHSENESDSQSDNENIIS
jgi:hypothetical protein